MYILKQRFDNKHKKVKFASDYRAMAVSENLKLFDVIINKTAWRNQSAKKVEFKDKILYFVTGKLRFIVEKVDKNFKNKDMISYNSDENYYLRMNEYEKNKEDFCSNFSGNDLLFD